MPLLSRSGKARQAHGPRQVARSQSKVLTDRTDIRRIGRHRLSRRIAVRETGHERQRIVRVEHMTERTNQCSPMHPLRELWQMLTDRKSRHRCRDRTEFAADLQCRFRLHIEHVDMRWSAQQIEHDDRLRRATNCPAGVLRLRHTSRLQPIQTAKQRQSAYPHQFAS